MFHRVSSVAPLPELEILVRFVSGEVKRYDVKPLLGKWKNFRALEQVRGLFPLVKVEPGGYGVSWNDEIDLSCDELWENGKVVNQ